MPEIKVPAVLSADGAATTVRVEGSTLAEAFDNHAAEHGAGLRDSVVEDGRIKEFINVYVNGEDVAHLAGLDTPVGGDDRIRVIPAASGGRRRR